MLLQLSKWQRQQSGSRGSKSGLSPVWTGLGMILGPSPDVPSEQVSSERTGATMGLVLQAFLIMALVN